jgi:outer membrane lipoprotein-sorting protein
VGGVKMPFTTLVTQLGLGTVTSHLKEVKFDVTVSDEDFKPKAK